MLNRLIFVVGRSVNVLVQIRPGCCMTRVRLRVAEAVSTMSFIALTLKRPSA